MTGWGCTKNEWTYSATRTSDPLLMVDSFEHSFSHSSAPPNENVGFTFTNHFTLDHPLHRLCQSQQLDYVPCAGPVFLHSSPLPLATRVHTSTRPSLSGDRNIQAICKEHLLQSQRLSLQFPFSHHLPEQAWKLDLTFLSPLISSALQRVW